MVCQSRHNLGAYGRIVAMTALHAKASYWIRQGIFRNLASFEEFETRVNAIAEEKDRTDKLLALY